ncbi:hypothetical protein AX777_18220 [Sphingobium yanoikuyae]|uniref:Uncharacterized protein n=1 Tax=Sphingobium yanoikuyae TaxID=13690 RepID=A0A177J9M5_SPHYA|nr:hypothetical protein [Sphingobium yanoikuyae]OAH36975.1 hypothetical protein AX777_18220 [Sphingobium yanoikuyae]
MSFGAIINHPDGSRQFDTDHPALCLRGKGTLNQANSYQETPPGMGGYYLYAKFSYTGIAPMIAIRPNSCNAGMVKMNRTGNTFEYIFRLFRFSAGWSVQYWVFDLPTAPTSLVGTGDALVFWNDAGQVTFDSRFPPMKMVSSILPGKTYAVVPGTGAAYRETVETDVDSLGNPIVIWRTEDGGFERDGETIAPRLYDTFDHYYSPNDIVFTPSFFYVDVTNV